MMLKILNWIFPKKKEKPFCQCKESDSTILKKLETGSMAEPGKEIKKIKIRMVYLICNTCNKSKLVLPKGIAHDPERGVYQGEEKDEEVLGSVVNGKPVMVA